MYERSSQDAHLFASQLGFRTMRQDKRTKLNALGDEGHVAH